MPPATARKAQLRRRFAAATFRGLDGALLREAGERAQENLLGAFPPGPGMRVALYAPIRSEVPTERIARAFRDAGGEVFYPSILPGGGLLFVPHREGDRFVEGRFGIPVPESPGIRECRTDGFDLVVVPGLAFDERGYRLGRGGGYYDRYLSRPVARTVAGLAYSWQVVRLLPTDAWDIPVGMVVTEESVIRVPPTGGARA